MAGILLDTRASLHHGRRVASSRLSLAPAGATRAGRPVTAEARDVMGVLVWALFGLTVGCLAKLLTPGRDSGTVVIVVLAMGGALVGGYVGYALGWYAGDEPTSLVMAGVGSVALLALYRLLVSRPSDF